MRYLHPEGVLGSSHGELQGAERRKDRGRGWGKKDVSWKSSLRANIGWGESERERKRKKGTDKRIKRKVENNARSIGFLERRRQTRAINNNVTSSKALLISTLYASHFIHRHLSSPPPPSPSPFSPPSPPPLLYYDKSFVKFDRLDDPRRFRFFW